MTHDFMKQHHTGPVDIKCSRGQRFHTPGLQAPMQHNTPPLTLPSGHTGVGRSPSGHTTHVPATPSHCG